MHIVSVGLLRSKRRRSCHKNNINSGKETYRIFNDLERDLNYDLSGCTRMGIQLLAMGYTAQESADMIRLCADAAAGLGKKRRAEMLVTTLARIKATDASSRQIIALQMAGINLDDVSGLWVCVSPGWIVGRIRNPQEPASRKAEDRVLKGNRRSSARECSPRGREHKKNRCALIRQSSLRRKAA